MADKKNTTSEELSGQEKQNSAGNDPLLDALVVIARSHGRQVSRDSLRSGLPLVDNRLTPALVSRAAQRADLEVSGGIESGHGYGGGRRQCEGHCSSGQWSGLL